MILFKVCVRDEGMRTLNRGQQQTKLILKRLQVLKKFPKSIKLAAEVLATLLSKAISNSISTGITALVSVFDKMTQHKHCFKSTVTQIM